MPSKSPDEKGCRNSGLPLGGVGAGSLELRPDGYFYRWMVMNNRPWGAAPATDAMERHGLRFGMTYDFGDGVHCLALGLHHGLDPIPDGWFWFSDPYHLPWVRHARAIHYRARIPFARLDYRFDDMPLRVSLEAWSPFIPGDAAASNTPGATLTFRVANPTRKPVRVGLMGLLKNVVGYDHADLSSLIEFQDGEPAGLLFRREGLAESAPTAGALGLFVAVDADGDPGAVSWAAHPYPGRLVWDPLRLEGRLPDTDHGRKEVVAGDAGAEKKIERPKGHPRGALAAHVRVPAGGERRVTFYLAWHFPNFIEMDRGENKGRVIGHQYATRFADATAVARWLHANGPDLRRRALAFADAFDRSTLPPWMLDAISASWVVLQRAAWWDREGRFAIWEGIGCCGLQTIDVGHYASQVILQFFPELDAAQNRLSAANRDPGGKIPHLMPGHLGCTDGRPGDRGRIDLGPQYVLAVWRHARWRGDLADARALWPALERNMALMAEYDANGDGLPDNQGKDQTYDQFPMYGTTAYVGFLHLAALRAMDDLAGRLGLTDRAAHYRALADHAAAALREQLWNGRYFILSRDVAQNARNTGCMTDQLNGDWFFRQSTGEPLVADAEARRALKSVLKLNRRTSGDQAWLANCTWPEGGAVTVRPTTSDQANCPWSGVEYAVAAHMLLLGLREEGRLVAADAFERYEAGGMRFNHIECGEIYYRCMSAWSLYNAEFGVVYDGFEKRLDLAPPEGDARFVVAVPGGLAAADWREKTGTLRLRGLSGVLEAREVRLRRRALDGAPLRLAEGETVTLRMPVRRPARAARK